MKIAHITHTFPPYEAGTGRVCYYNALELARLGHDVTVFTSNYPPGEYEYPPEMTVKRLPTPMRLGNAPLMPGIVAQTRGFDIFHLHHPFIFGAELTRIASTLWRTPFVMTHHNDLITEGSRARQVMFDTYTPFSRTFSAGQASKYCVVSMDHAENCSLTPVYARNWDDVVEIPNGMDTAHFHAGIDTEFLYEKYANQGLTKDTPVVLLVAALDSAHTFKGVYTLIDSFAHLASDNAVLMVVGDGDLRPTYQAYAQERGLGGRAIFPGKVPHEHLGAYYTLASVAVLPSTPPESFGMVLIEAQACGTPVVGSDIPGVRSVVEDGVTGYHVRPNDPKMLAAKIDLILSDPARAKQMGQAGLEMVFERYAWKSIAKKLEATYESVLASK